MMAADGSDYVGNTLGQSVPYGAMKVTATVTPANAKNKRLSWSFAWSSGSGWASGKDVRDFFSLRTNGANAHEAYLWASAPFGTSIVVTVSSTDGSNKSATMTVDFAKRMNGLTEIEGFSDDVWFDFSTFTVYQSNSYALQPGPNLEDIEYTATYTVGSKAITWKLVDCIVVFDDDFRETAEQMLDMPTRETFSYGSGSYKNIIHNMFDSADLEAFWDREDAASLWTDFAMSLDYSAYVGGMTFYFESLSTDSLGNKYTYSVTFKIETDFSGGLPVANVALSDSEMTI